MSDVLPWTSRSARRGDGWPLDDFWCPLTRSTPGWAYETTDVRGKVLDRAMSLPVAQRRARDIVSSHPRSAGRRICVVDIVSDGVFVEQVRADDPPLSSLT